MVDSSSQSGGGGASERGLSLSPQLPGAPPNVESVGGGADIIDLAVFRASANMMEPTALSAGAAEVTGVGNLYQGDIMSDHTREEMKAEIAASEARGETKIARIEGKLDLVVSKIDGINSRLDDVRHDYRATRANIWVVGIGLAVLIVGMAALFPAFFGIGIQIRDIIDKAFEAHISSSAPVPPRR